MDLPPTMILTPYNYFEWKPKVLLLLRSRGFIELLWEPKKNPIPPLRKPNFLTEWMKLLDFSTCLFLHELLFHVESSTTPNEVWTTWRASLERKMKCMVIF
jgi:hypothetical protein